MKRRLMESNQVGAEVRRIHVIYFLSRKGRIEQPHLIRVHHLSRNGVHLRDVKRWLGELRGKDMPESFSWSYKRRYKSGYVWQDLLDEDLITPISDNEYVLKGSEISSTTTIEDSPSEKRYSMHKEEEDSDRIPSSTEENPDDDHHHHQETKMDQPTKISSPEIEEESPTFGSEQSSTLTDDSMKTKDRDQDQEKNSSFQTPKEEMHEESDKSEGSSYYSPLSSKRNKKANNVMSEEKISAAPSSSASTSSTAQPSFSKSRSYSNASHLFRNLITCGAVETNDSVMLTISRRNKPPANANLSSLDKQNHVSNGTKELLQIGDKLGGSQRIFGTNWNQQRQSSGRKSFDGVRASQKNNSEFNNQKTNAAHKPIYGPPCSQCGKPFKPEKLHAHMKSCKGMKAWAKYSGPAISTAAADKPAESPQENLVSGYYLTH
ncbi:protein SOSEKI 1-like [Coffea arabica]|uniref:Protein SOSEKI 1-like n=1 Tax=Coffea arabica TaxID=13443 RepID=A0A6P6VIV2_COFAR|nr:uncharacterized protein LOC113722833 [Coffea arabica]